MGSNKGFLVVSLILVILILLGVIGYAFAIKPAINSYVINNQNQGIDFAVSNILQQLQQNGYVQIPVGNQTLILVPAQQQGATPGA